FQGTVTGERYRQEFLDPFIHQLDDEELHVGYFQQDGATAHTAGLTLEYLREFYDNRLISLGSDQEFPPRSPDLTPLDFSVFGYIKDQVFKQEFHNLEQLQDEITRCCLTIDREMLQNIFQNMKRRIRLCLQSNGEHFQHLL
ncbi:DDE 3 domain containing protein, partial [Asbolus verrucosus]